MRNKAICKMLIPNSSFIIPCSPAPFFTCYGCFVHTELSLAFLYVPGVPLVASVA
jgi:hypothetical protein